MAEIIETANNAYEERDKANDQIDSLRSKAKREAKDFENELKDISQLAENNRIAIELINKNNEKRLERADQGDANSMADKIAKTKSSKGLKSQNIDPQLQEKHYKLRLDYVKIEVTTNIKKFDELIDTFKKLEETNFEKFKYVIELSNEIEFVEHQIAEYKSEMKNFLEKGNSKTENKTKHLKELDDKSQSCQAKAQFFESKYSSSQKTLNSITYARLTQHPRREALQRNRVRQGRSQQGLRHADRQRKQPAAVPRPHRKALRTHHRVLQENRQRSTLRSPEKPNLELPAAALRTRKSRIHENPESRKRKNPGFRFAALTQMTSSKTQTKAERTSPR